MSLASNPPARPELSRGTCEVWDRLKWTPSTTVSVVTVEQRKEENQKLGAERRAEAVPVDIRGATGDCAAYINGVYVPTEEICDGWPVYRKQGDEGDEGDEDTWLEYLSATKRVSWLCYSCLLSK